MTASPYEYVQFSEAVGRRCGPTQAERQHWAGLRGRGRRTYAHTSTYCGCRSHMDDRGRRSQPCCPSSHCPVSRPGEVDGGPQWRCVRHGETQASLVVGASPIWATRNLREMRVRCVACRPPGSALVPIGERETVEEKEAPPPRPLALMDTWQRSSLVPHRSR